MSKLLNLILALFAIYVISHSVSPHRMDASAAAAETAAAVERQAVATAAEAALPAQARPETEDGVISFQGISIDLNALEREVCSRTSLCA